MQSKFKLLLMIVLATAIEYYDYGIFAYLAVYISKSLVVTENKFMLDIFAYSLIAIGALMRPIGGVFVAHFGDKYSRVKVFKLIVFLSIACSLAMALIPSASFISYGATLLLIFVRLVQGIAVGSEFPSALVFAYEMPQNKLKPLYCAIPSLGNNLGLLLSSVVAGALINYASVSDSFWRLAFLLGAILGGVNYFIRRDMVDSSEYVSYVKQYKIKYPLIELVRNNKQRIIQLFLFGLFVLTCVAFYLIFAPQILAKYYMLPIKSLQHYNSYLIIALMFGSLLTGLISNKIGKNIVVVLVILLLWLSAIGFYNYNLANMSLLEHLHLLICFILGLLCGKFSILLANAFVPNVRFSGIALVYGLCALCNGCYMLILDVLMKLSGNNLWVPYYYLLACGTLAIIALLRLDKNIFRNL